jgi:hypothetical protein
MKSAVYLVSVEVAPMAGSAMPEGAKGAFVYALVVSRGALPARKTVMQQLERDRYRLVKVEFARTYAEVEWPEANEKTEYDQLAKTAESTGQVVYGPFYTFDSDD